MRKADNLPPSCAVVTKSGNLNFLRTSGPVQASNGTALPLFISTHNGDGTFQNFRILTVSVIYIICMFSVMSFCMHSATFYQLFFSNVIKNLLCDY